MSVYMEPYSITINLVNALLDRYNNNIKQVNSLKIYIDLMVQEKLPRASWDSDINQIIS